MNTNPVNYNNGLVLYDNKPICSAVSGGDWEYTPVDYNLVYHVNPDASGNYHQDAWTAFVGYYSLYSADNPSGPWTGERRPNVIYNCFADDFVPTESGTIIKNGRIISSDSGGGSLVTLRSPQDLSANYILNNVPYITEAQPLLYLQQGVPNSQPASARCTCEIDYAKIDASRLHPSGYAEVYTDGGAYLWLPHGCTSVKNVHLTGMCLSENHYNREETTAGYSIWHERSFCPQIYENIEIKYASPYSASKILHVGGMYLAGRRGNLTAIGLPIKDTEIGYVFKNINAEGLGFCIMDSRLSRNGVSAYSHVTIENYTGALRTYQESGTEDILLPMPLSAYTFKGNNEIVINDRLYSAGGAGYYLGGPPVSGLFDCKFIDVPTIRLKSTYEIPELKPVDRPGYGNGFNNLSSTNWTIKSTDTANNRLILKNSRSYPFNLSGKAFILDGVHLEQGTEFYITNCSGTVHTLNGATYTGVYKV